jgi:hypothetical protein
MPACLATRSHHRQLFVRALAPQEVDTARDKPALVRGLCSQVQVDPYCERDITHVVGMHPLEYSSPSIAIPASYCPSSKHVSTMPRMFLSISRSSAIKG